MITNIIKNLLFVLKEIKNVSKSVLPIIAFMAFLSVLMSVAELFFMKFIIDYVLSNVFRIEKLIFYLLLYFLIICLVKVFNNIIIGAYINKFEVKLKSHTIPKIYKKAREIDIINFNNLEFYNKLNRAMEESDTRYFIVLMQLFSFFVSIFVFLSVFVVYHDLYILLATAINVSVYMIYYFLENKKKYEFEKNEEVFFRYEDYMGRVFSEKEYAQELRISLEIKDKLLNNFAELSKTYRNHYNIYLSRFMRNSILMTTFSYFIYWISSIYISSLLLNVKISIGDFLVLINVVSTMSMQLINVLQVLPNIYQSSLYINDINEILNYPTSFSNDDKRMDVRGFHCIELKNVFFKYNEQLAFELHDLSFSIKKDEVIAIVGLNGSGKSTIIDCILGLIQPDRGSIELNGISYNKYNSQSLRNLFSVVFQEYQIYEISVAENILMREIISDEDIAIVEEALKYVNLYEKVLSLEKGIHTILSSDGDNVEFSGGEKQKIVIARAYAKKAPILIFDEPTSALDVYTTNAFYSDMFKMKKCGNRTIIFTSHKLHYVVHADRIIYIENGTVLEMGSHDELMQLNKGYATLYNLQMNELFAK